MLAVRGCVASISVVVLRWFKSRACTHRLLSSAWYGDGRNLRDLKANRTCFWVSSGGSGGGVSSEDIVCKERKSVDLELTSWVERQPQTVAFLGITKPSRACELDTTLKTQTGSPERTRCRRLSHSTTIAPMSNLLRAYNSAS